MGIKGLWQALREYVDDGHLSQFRGQRVAVDMYVWLHRCVHRSVRIRTEAVTAFFEEKYRDSKSTADPVNSVDSGGGAVPIASPPPLSIDDVIMFDDEFVTLVVDKVSALQRFGVVPVCVFDGAEMPMKGGTDEERKLRRADAFQSALVKLDQLYCDARRRRGYTADSRATGERITLPRDARLYEEAVQLLEKAVDISTELAHAVIQVLKEERHVECIVSPYEADAQLAYLCRQGYVAAAASEDSDLIAYYCPCIISKLDTFSGKCEVLQPPLCAPQFFQRMAATRAVTSFAASVVLGPASAHRRAAPVADVIGRGHDSVNSTHARMRSTALQSLQRSDETRRGGAAAAGACTDEVGTATSKGVFTYESFLLGCILSGCDYVPNLRSIGVKKAFKLVAHASSLRQCFTKLERDFGFPADELRHYRKRILEAFYCFAHHLVYSPLTHSIVTYHPLPDSNSGGTEFKTQLVGSIWPPPIAQEVCVQCLKDPCTLQLYRGVYQPCVTQYLQRTRRGQASLKSYSGFEGMSSNRVVVRPGKPWRDGSTLPQCDLGTESFAVPLKKQRVASGFIGSVAAPAQSLIASSKNKEVVVVRSRFFMVRGRTAVREQWSTSETDNEEDVEGGDAELSMMVPRQPSVCPAAPVTGAGAGGCSSHVSVEPCTASPALMLTTKVDSGSLADDSFNGVGASATISSRRTADTTGDEGSWKMMDGGPSRDCTRLDGDVNSLCTVSQRGSGDASPSAASLLCTLNSAQSLADSESTRAVEFEVEGERRAAHASVLKEGMREDCCLAETPDAEPYAYGIAQCTDATTEAVGMRGAQSALSPPRCDCPFGYWQCNRAHSIFESCFLGRQWSRDEGLPPPPPPSSSSLNPSTARAPASTADSSPASLHPSPASPLQPSLSSLLGSAASKYVPRAFRPPRSIATASPSPVSPHKTSQHALLTVDGASTKPEESAAL
ncbi:hypothetical protein JKF63_04909 [Porcisia hertigi]|uniref:Exonuclease 1 n=1 Tax=Porcisia hertigi TaxID=2761500 RepID=A0A836LBU9_9TRYP|nr:hypothetical protein JKF63_04909 [Porcisia hertigi]